MYPDFFILLHESYHRNVLHRKPEKSRTLENFINPQIIPVRERGQEEIFGVILFPQRDFSTSDHFLNK